MCHEWDIGIKDIYFFSYANNRGIKFSPYLHQSRVPHCAKLYALSRLLSGCCSLLILSKIYLVNVSKHLPGDLLWLVCVTTFLFCDHCCVFSMKIYFTLILSAYCPRAFACRCMAKNRLSIIKCVERNLESRSRWSTNASRSIIWLIVAITAWCLLVQNIGDSPWAWVEPPKYPSHPQ